MIYKKAILAFLLLCSSHKTSCDFFTFEERAIFMVFMAVPVFIVGIDLLYEKIKASIPELLLKTKNPNTINFLFRCMEFFTFKPYEFYENTIITQKSINMTLVNMLFKKYDLPTGMWATEGYLGEPIYLAIKKGNNEFLTYVLSKKTDRTQYLDDARCGPEMYHDLLYALIHANNGKSKYITIMKTLLKRVLSSNISLYFFSDESKSHPLAAAAYQGIRAFNDKNYMLFDSYKYMFSLLLEHKPSILLNHEPSNPTINNFKFKENSICRIAQFLSIAENDDLCTDFFNNHLTKQNQHRVFFDTLKGVHDHNKYQAFYQKLTDLLSDTVD